jgi:DNA-binding Xre family transcriptional regulator
MANRSTYLGELIWQKRCHKRKLKPVSYRIAAAECNISTSTMCRIANGGKPDIVTMNRLCKWLNVPVEDVIDGFSDPVR